MKKFKSGQKVVFSTEKLKGEFAHHETAITPKEKEIVTISKEIGFAGVWYELKEYPKTLEGMLQGFHELVLFPVEEISKEETEKIFSKLTKSIKQLETV